ncbi:ECF transporter S component [Williamsoniiplasma luminosum]|uniref:ECF transporter S component n=1 Tax=Williamsoniiplasma luminosum TaxID=214888 RepID=A0A2S0NJS2_9MOLU|nr:ECF transporter S component [Williamsoniiplasma luminosum]AVP49257.1 MAG: ECF transporter S component [Williamsoniiplasma luminosum]
MKNKEKKSQKDFDLLTEANEAKKEHSETQDHYHDKKHYDAKGNIDYITREDFRIRNHFKYTRRNLILKISLTALFLALSVAAAAIDMALEIIAIPIGQLRLSTRFIDVVVIFLALPVVGPLFGMLIAFVEPWIHLMIDPNHLPLQILVDAITNTIIVLTTWFVFYIAFKNSPIHKDPNKKIDLYKRTIPLIIMFFVSTIIATLLFVFALFIQEKNMVIHTDHDHDHIQWENLNWTIIGVVLGMNFLRFAIAYTTFFFIEVRMRPINHRYR